jgi:hypothetical protein
MSGEQAEADGSTSARLLAAARAGRAEAVGRVLDLAAGAGEESLDVPTPTSDSLRTCTDQFCIGIVWCCDGWSRFLLVGAGGCGG